MADMMGITVMVFITILSIFGILAGAWQLNESLKLKRSS